MIISESLRVKLRQAADEKALTTGKGKTKGYIIIALGAILLVLAFLFIIPSGNK